MHKDAHIVHFNAQSQEHGAQPARAAVLSAHGQYARIVNSWVEQRGLDRADYGTHALRRTKARLSCTQRFMSRTRPAEIQIELPQSGRS
jgi:hypothetical protein